MNTAAKFALLAGLTFAGATFALGQQHPQQEHPPTSAQVVVLDECDPTTFNAVLGPDFCKNVALGEFTTFDDLFGDGHGNQ